MAVPTILSVDPPVGAADGFTLLFIAGTGFSVPPEPPLLGPTTAPAPTMRVTVGGRSARDVRVYDSETLSCLTPEGDPFDHECSGVFAGSVFVSAGHPVKEGARLRFARGAPAPLLPPDHEAAVAYYARDVVPGASFAVSTSVGGLAFAVADGPATVRTEGYAAVTVANLAQDGSVVPGETAELEYAFSYRRPDLTRPGALARIVRAIVRDLQRVHENVTYVQTHVDYDAQSGTAYVTLARSGTLPAILITNPRFERSPTRPRLREESVVVGGTRFVRKREKVLLDVTFEVYALSQAALALNMKEALMVHARKTSQLAVQRGDLADLDDVVRYAITTNFSNSSIVSESLESGTQSSAMEITVHDCVLEESPGMPQQAPSGFPGDIAYENVLAYGYVLADPLVDAQPA
jgi:hypothetical protein